MLYTLFWLIRHYESGSLGELLIIKSIIEMHNYIECINIILAKIFRHEHFQEGLLLKIKLIRISIWAVCLGAKLSHFKWNIWKSCNPK